MKSPGVYRIYNMLTKRSYIGSSSKDWRNRRNGHASLLKRKKHPSKAMQEDWDKFGPESFQFLCVCECDADKVIDIEKAAAAEFKAFDKEFGYNSNPINGPRFRGGRPCGSICKVRFSRMVTREVAERLADLIETPETLERMELLFKGGSVVGWKSKLVDGMKGKHTSTIESGKDEIRLIGIADGLGYDKDSDRIWAAKRIKELEDKIKEYEQMYG